jgi:hypothetical protein
MQGGLCKASPVCCSTRTALMLLFQLQALILPTHLSTAMSPVSATELTFRHSRLGTLGLCPKSGCRRLKPSVPFLSASLVAGIRAPFLGVLSVLLPHSCIGRMPFPLSRGNPLFANSVSTAALSHGCLRVSHSPVYRHRFVALTSLEA